ncbi:DUF1963 domain-containing protein [Pseudomonas sp. W2-17]|uniref:DUF1963 domain-containing protein n=1 Tax=Pseudomonas sp. W2-17 TaxID=3058039 RepID=UPI0034E0BAD4
MVEVNGIVVLPESKHGSDRYSGIVLGGDRANVDYWPSNPDGEPLLLVATIECALLKKTTAITALPNTGFLSIFSTYSTTEYFLENITYSGDPSELEAIKAGYTAVVFSEGEAQQSSPVSSVPVTVTRLENREVSEDAFPVFSLCSSTPPNGLEVPADIANEYEFVLQLYSADFPDPFKDIFYLSDALGYLFLNKNGSGEGLFFVQSA